MFIDIDVRSYMTLNHRFNGIRVHSGIITPVEWNIDIKIAGTNIDTEQGYAASNLSFQRLKFWLDTVLDDVILINPLYEPCDFFDDFFTNTLIHTPGDPTDDLIVRLIHSKISAITQKKIVIGEILLTSSDTSVVQHFSCPDGNYQLPNLGQVLGPDSKPLFKNPWWERDDGRTYDYDKEELEKPTIKELLSSDIMDEFEKGLKEEAKAVEKDLAEVIRVDTWGPKLVK